MIGMGLGSQPTTECGVFGSYQSLNLDGNSDYVSCPSALKDAINLTATTVSFWVNLVQNDGDTSQSIFKIWTDADNQFFLQYHKYYTEWRATIKTDGDARTATYNVPGSSNNDGSGYDDGWQHFVACFTVSSGAYSIKIYRNGSLIQNTAGASGQGNWVGLVGAIHIGANQDGSGSFMDGQIDQFAFWDIELPATAITSIYNNGIMTDLTTVQSRYTQTANLIGYYQFEGNANDSSNTNAHGDLNGTAGFSTSQP